LGGVNYRLGMITGDEESPSPSSYK
jgi:hypothetical protein